MYITRSPPLLFIGMEAFAFRRLVYCKHGQGKSDRIWRGCWPGALPGAGTEVGCCTGEALFLRSGVSQCVRVEVCADRARRLFVFVFSFTVFSFLLQYVFFVVFCQKLASSQCILWTTTLLVDAHCTFEMVGIIHFGRLVASSARPEIVFFFSPHPALLYVCYLVLVYVLLILQYSS